MIVLKNVGTTSIKFKGFHLLGLIISTEKRIQNSELITELFSSDIIRLLKGIKEEMEGEDDDE